MLKLFIYLDDIFLYTYLSKWDFNSQFGMVKISLMIFILICFTTKRHPIQAYDYMYIYLAAKCVVHRLNEIDGFV